jgi:hypothetical protein
MGPVYRVIYLDLRIYQYAPPTSAKNGISASTTRPIGFRQPEHEAVLIEGPTPGDDFAELHGDRRRYPKPAPSLCLGSLPSRARVS